MTDKGRRSFFRRAFTGAAGVAAAAVTSRVAAAPVVVEKTVEVEKIVVVPGALVWAREEFGYGTQTLEPGEVFALTGLRNDALLTGQGYARPVGDHLIVDCNCGRRFVTGFAIVHSRDYFAEHLDRSGHRAQMARQGAAPLTVNVNVNALEDIGKEATDRLMAELERKVGLPPSQGRRL